MNKDTVFVLGYGNQERKKYNGLEELSQQTRYPGDITVGNFHYIIDTLLTNPSLFNVPKPGYFMYQDWRDIDTNDLVSAINFFNSVIVDENPEFENPEYGFKYWYGISDEKSPITNATRQQGYLNYRTQQRLQCEFYSYLLKNGSQDNKNWLSALQNIYPEQWKAQQDAYEAQRKKASQANKARSEFQKSFEKATKESLYDTIDFLMEYGGTLRAEGYTTSYGTSDSPELNRSCIVDLYYNKNEDYFNANYMNYIREFGEVGMKSYDNIDQDQAERVLKSAWIDEWGNEGTKVSIDTHDNSWQVVLGTIGTNENYISEAGYDWQHGMSNNAVNAYENGEKPISKWSKREIIDTVTHELNNPSTYDVKSGYYTNFLANKDRVLDFYKKLPIKALRELTLEKVSWHHTGKFYNTTNFYKVGELETLYYKLDSSDYANQFQDILEGADVVKMSDYRFNEETLMEKVISKFLHGNNYYGLYKACRILNAFPKKYIEKNLDVELSDEQFSNLKADLKYMVDLGNLEESYMKKSKAKSSKLDKYTTYINAFKVASDELSKQSLDTNDNGTPEPKDDLTSGQKSLVWERKK